MVTRRKKVIAATGVMVAGFALACLVGPPSDSLGDVPLEQPTTAFSDHDSVEFDADKPANRPIDDAAEHRQHIVNKSADAPLAASGHVQEMRDGRDDNPLVDVRPPAPTRAGMQKSTPPELPENFQPDRAAGDQQLVNNAPRRTPTAKPEAIDHVVHNGDTLERIARRYLGDESRAIDIFELNRDVLKNPHILPIGVELRIPRDPS